jgi:uncharacterized sporulation protein YeaH/YhbH (DUF444 family)
MQVFFEDLALPHLIRTQLAETPEWKTHRAGFSSDGTPNNLHVVRSMRGALGRRIALGGESRRELHALEDLVAQMLRQPSDDPAVKQQLKEAQERIAALKARLGASPSSTRSTCAFAAGCGCRCPPARR